MDSKSYSVLTVIQVLCIIFLTAQSLSRWETIQDREEEILQLQDRLDTCNAAVESARNQRGTCLQDVEALEVSLNVASTDLRRCDEWYAVREYARDADY